MEFHNQLPKQEVHENFEDLKPKATLVVKVKVFLEVHKEQNSLAAESITIFFL